MEAAVDGFLARTADVCLGKDRRGPFFKDRIGIIQGVMILFLIALDTAGAIINVTRVAVMALGTEYLKILMRHIPHDGITDEIWTEVRNGVRHRLRFQFSGDGRWTRHEMIAYLATIINGTPEKRFRYAYAFSGGVRVWLWKDKAWEEITMADKDFDQCDKMVEEHKERIQICDELEHQPTIDATDSTNHKLEIGGATVRVKGNNHAAPLALKSHNGGGSTGQANGVKWVRHEEGAILTDKAMVANHVLQMDDEKRHAFPDMTANIIPPVVQMGDEIEYWDESTRALRTAMVTTFIWVVSKIGDRVLWGKVPAFEGIGKIVSGTPIFRNKKLVSVVTKSNGKHYAISGISSTSGHAKAKNIRLRNMRKGESCYGNMIAGYADIKDEALREKNVDYGPLNIEIVVDEEKARVIGWVGDNHETFHVRM